MLNLLKFEAPLCSPSAKTQKTDSTTTGESVKKPVMTDASTDMGLLLSDLDHTRSFWESQPKPVKIHTTRRTDMDPDADTGMETEAPWQTQKKRKKSESKGTWNNFCPTWRTYECGQDNITHEAERDEEKPGQAETPSDSDQGEDRNMICRHGPIAERRERNQTGRLWRTTSGNEEDMGRSPPLRNKKRP